MANEIKSYAAAWQGPIVLACRKCQKKLKKEDGFKKLANLKKTVKNRSKRQHQDPLHLLNVPCMDLCPKNAVTVCVPGLSDERLYIIRTEEDLVSLLRTSN